MIRLVLIEQGEAGALAICQNVCTVNCREISYFGLTACFIINKYELIAFALYYFSYEEADKAWG